MKRILLILTLIVAFSFQADAQSYVQPPIKSKELMKWTPLQDLDTALYGATAFNNDGIPWVTLGDTASIQYSKPKHRKSTLVPNGALTTWKTDKTFEFVGRKRIGAMTFKLSNKIYIAGGRFVGDSAMIDSVYGGRVFDSTLMDVWQFNPASKVWTQRADMINKHAIDGNDTLGRAYGVAFVLNGVAHVGLGYSKKYLPIDSVTWKNNVYPTTFPTVDPSKYQSIPLPPHVFRVGGNVLDPAFSETRLYNDIFSYDTLSNKWTFVTSYSGFNTAAANRGRYGCVAFVVRDSSHARPTKPAIAYIGLGSDGQGLHNEFYRFQRVGSSGIFSQEASFPFTPRNYSQAVGIGDYGYVTCGFDGLPQRDFYEYSLETKAWDRYADFPDTGRYQMADVLIDQKWYFFGGREATDNTSKEVYVLKLDTNKIRITKIFDADSIFCTKDTIKVAYKGYYDAFTGTFLTNNYMVLEAVYFDDITQAFVTIKLDSINTNKFIDTLKFVYRPSISDRKYFLSIRATHPSIPGVISSGTFRLQQGPDIQTQPLTTVIDIHKKGNFRVEAVGTNITYQWFKEPGIAVKNDSFQYYDTIANVNKYFHHIKGATDSMIVFDSVRVSDSGVYYLVVSGTCSPPATSIKVKLNVVNTPTPLIIKQPADTIVCQNTAAQIQVDVASLTAKYMWVRIDTIIQPNNNTFDTTIVRDTITNGGNFSGATTNILKFNSARAIDTGYYYVYIYESSGADTTSRFAKFSIEKSANILVQPALYIKKHEFESASFWLKAEGSGLTYQWYKDNVAIPGANTDSLVISNITLKNAGFYYCIVKTKCGNQAQSGFGLLEVDPFPLITTEPTNPSKACQGEDLDLIVQAKGANLSYRWYKVPNTDLFVNGPGNVSGADTRKLTITGLSPADNGQYYCIVSSDSAHSDTSIFATVASKPIPPQPVIVELSKCRFIQDTTKINCNVKEHRWYFNGVYQDTNKNQPIIAVGKRAGQFQLVIICDGCYSVKSDPLFCLNAGLEKPTVGSLNIYPNPVNYGNVTIEIPENLSGNIELKLYDISGRLLWNGKANGSDKYASIDMTTLAAGMYQIQLINDDKIFTSKVIVE